MAYCPNCGAEAEAGTRYCSNCGANIAGADAPSPPPPPPGASGYGEFGQYGSSGDGPPVPDYLTQSILVTVLGVCACLALPVGIAAIVFASQARSKAAAGDIDGAMGASRTARILCWVALGVALASLFIGGLVGVGGGFDTRGRM